MVFDWPFYAMPKLERWTYEAGRTVIIRDAAYATPRLAEKGASQTFEDSHTLALVLSDVSRDASDQ